MKIYVLRHEELEDDVTFFSSLTENGLNNAKMLSNEIEKLDIDYIFCSPFLRTIQTIYPYSLKNNHLINIEYSLYEFIGESMFNWNNFKNEYQQHFKNNPKFKKCINKDYKSLINTDQLKYPESYSKLDSYIRTSNFIEYLLENYKYTNASILLVTHMTPVNMIRNYFNYETISFEDGYYPTGTIEQVYSN